MPEGPAAKNPETASTLLERIKLFLYCYNAAYVFQIAMGLHFLFNLQASHLSHLNPHVALSFWRKHIHMLLLLSVLYLWQEIVNCLMEEILHLYPYQHLISCSLANSLTIPLHA